MLTKTCPAKVKAVGGDDGLQEGQFRALVSVFGNKDSYGDVVEPGAFTDTLAEWKSRGDPIPVYWSHQMADPDYNLGHVVSAEETDAGLEVVGQLDMESPKSAQVYRLMKGRRVTQFSFAYDVVDGEQIKSGDGDSYFSLKKLNLYEVGPTPIGANQETDLLGVKALVDRALADVKAGRVLSAKNETSLRDALTTLESSASQIKGVLAALDGANEPGKASTDGPAKDEEPVGAKSEEPSQTVPAKRLEAELILLALENR